MASSAPNRSLSDVLDEIKSILRLCKKLQNSPQHWHLFEPGWIASILDSSIKKLGSATASRDISEGFECLRKLLEILEDLSERRLHNGVQYVTAAIVRQKSCLGDDERKSQQKQPSKPSNNLILGGKSFTIKAIGTTNHRSSATLEALRLVWNETRSRLDCCKGRHTISDAFPETRVIPKDITAFLHAPKYEKVLLMSSVGGKVDAPIFIRMNCVKDVEELFKFLHQMSGNGFERQCVSNTVLDKLTAAHE